ncbi:Hsp20/alpha crystallin family protein [Gloeobacter kilaueensis]|uniref:Heat shock protein Hsp20 n=1 Tax=Gloeobacter kilaueensis (strain ATCC BAA-2537 / CCAP 1431/1 / ULC 316 / JS1) TaxID=1183438 RepID=U5QMP8_GLOK1|nr:Hsp20/alpha crystallin family protein [Gloeobacter kilaueensis]AGY58930.1 heat shock protein Hsp20 [Gloeobacter kilaueensis JS1]
MAIVRYSPAREIGSLRNDMMDRVFNGFFGPLSNRDFTPAIRVWESPEAYTVQAVVPGLERDSLDIQAAPHGLSISGKFSFAVPEEVTVRHSEYGDGEFRRTLQLSTQIRSEGVKASYTDGILTITLPKIESQRVVKVKLDDVAQGETN